MDGSEILILVVTLHCVYHEKGYTLLKQTLNAIEQDDT